MNKVALRAAVLLIALPLSAQACAGIGFALSASVAEHCSIGKVTRSQGREPTIVVHSTCNAAMFRLRFADLTAQTPIRSVEGNGAATNIRADGVWVMPRRPGSQVTVVHFAEALPASGLGTITLETF